MKHFSNLSLNITDSSLMYTNEVQETTVNIVELAREYCAGLDQRALFVLGLIGLMGLVIQIWYKWFKMPEKWYLQSVDAFLSVTTLAATLLIYLLWR